MSASTTVLPLISASAEAKKVSTLLTPSPVSVADSEGNGEGNGQTSKEGDKLVEERNGTSDQAMQPAPPKKRSGLRRVFACWTWWCVGAQQRLQEHQE